MRLNLTNKQIYALFGTSFILIAIPLTVLSVLNSRELRGRAAGTASLSLVPGTSTVNQNTSITVEVWENSGTDSVNGVQANLSYDATKLDYVSTSNSTAFTNDLQTVGGSGSVKLGRGTALGTAVTGNNLVARVSFNARAVPGATTVTFATGSQILRSTDNVDILGSTSVGTYTIVDPAPTVTLTAPVTGIKVKGTTTLTATASDDVAVTKVEFYVDGALVNTDTTTPYSYNLDTTTLTNANHTVFAKAYDVTGSTSSATATTTVDNLAPSVSVTAPVNNAVVRASITVSANASDANGVSQVEFLVDGAVNNTDTISPYSYSLNTTALTNANHTIVARATDTVGNIASSTSVTITVDNQAPTTPTGLTATLVTSTQANLSWTASTDNRGVTGYDIYRNSTKITTVTTTSYSDTGLTAGTTYSWYVQALDQAGNTSASSNTVSVNLKIGDINLDGFVDITDYSILSSHYASVYPPADLNGNGIVDITDYSILSSHFGT